MYDGICNYPRLSFEAGRSHAAMPAPPTSSSCQDGKANELLNLPCVDRFAWIVGSLSNCEGFGPGPLGKVASSDSASC